MAKIKKAPIFTFEELDIPKGERLYHKEDPKHTCVVLDKKQGVRYEHKKIKDSSKSISGWTNYVYSKIRGREIRGNFAPLPNWEYDGETLQKRRSRIKKKETTIEASLENKQEGMVYILTNPCMEGIIKIGKTRISVEQRINQLSYPTGVPARFKFNCAIRVKDYHEVEKYLHEKFKEKRINENKEFFRMSPEEAQIALLTSHEPVAISEEDVVENEDEKKILSNAHAKDRKQIENFNFNMIKIKDNEILTFIGDENITCTVAPVSDTNPRRNKVVYEKTETTLSDAAKQSLKKKERKFTAVRGPYYWYYGKKSLMDIRNEIYDE